MRKPWTVEELVLGIQRQDRAALGRAITLIESDHPSDQRAAETLLEQVLPQAGTSFRIGITGVPGVGKSTFIESLGKFLTAQGIRVAVLAVDPSSQITGGSILGDKTRMHELAMDPLAFIRPSPSGGSLGGVAQRTREAILLCEAAGYEVIFVETVGVGQSETLVAQMVDLFLALMLPGGGDELQGIKRGLLEHVDMLAINKADGERKHLAEVAQQDYQRALTILRHGEEGLAVPIVYCCSAITRTGINEMWGAMRDFREQKMRTGEWLERRQEQAVSWLWQALREELVARLQRDPQIQKQLNEVAQDVRDLRVLPTRASRQILEKLK